MAYTYVLADILSPNMASLCSCKIKEHSKEAKKKTLRGSASMAYIHGTTREDPFSISRTTNTKG
jgi:hypothetical protein